LGCRHQHAIAALDRVTAGRAAVNNGGRLLTRDGRARRTYDLLGVNYELVGLL